MSGSEIDESLFTVKEAAKLLGVSEYTVRKKLRDGDLKGVITSDKEGYKISSRELIDYLQKNDKPIPAALAALVPGAFALTAGAGALALGVSALPFGLLGGAFAGLASLFGRDKYEKVFKDGESLDLSVGSLRDQIDMIKYQIEALELKGDNKSVEDEQKILEFKTQIKQLEQRIKLLKLEYKMNHDA